MKYNREFEIAWLGLKPGPKTYIYDIDDRFMQEREAGEEFKNWNATIKLEFDKHENFFMLKFDIDGKVTVACDRCGEDFELKLWDEFNLVIKLMGVDETEIPEEEDDVVFISRADTVIDVSVWMYEFLMLSVPLQRLHPDTKEGKPGCNEEVLKLLDSLAEKDEEEPTNPLWKALKGLKIDEEASDNNKN